MAPRVIARSRDRFEPRPGGHVPAACKPALEPCQRRRNIALRRARKAAGKDRRRALPHGAGRYLKAKARNRAVGIKVKAKRDGASADGRTRSGLMRETV